MPAAQSVLPGLSPGLAPPDREGAGLFLPIWQADRPGMVLHGTAVAMTQGVPHPPILTVGCTGMLAAATLELADRGHPLWVLSRGADRFAAEHSSASRTLIPIASDYTGDLTGSLEAVPGGGWLVAWIHGDDTAILELIVSVTKPSRVVHVVGSAWADPSRDIPAPRLPSGTLYQRAVLGFVPEAWGSRWLTHAEISRGVLDVLDGDRPLTVVGSVEPWSARP